jgi:hypothetical protein
MGKKRNSGVVLILSFLTLGIYYIVWYYMINKEIKLHDSNQQFSPGFAAFALFIPIVNLVSLYNTANRIKIMQKADGSNDLISPGAALVWALLFGIGYPIYIQGTLNNHWYEHNLKLNQMPIQLPVPPPTATAAGIGAGLLGLILLVVLIWRMVGSTPEKIVAEPVVGGGQQTFTPTLVSPVVKPPIPHTSPPIAGDHLIQSSFDKGAKPKLPKTDDHEKGQAKSQSNQSPYNVEVNIQPGKTNDLGAIKFPPQNPPLLVSGRTRKLQQANAWQAEIDLWSLEVGKVCGTINFRSLRCGGDLIYLGEKDGGLLFKENLTFGNCVKGCDLWLKPDGSFYKEIQKGRVTGFGVLTDGSTEPTIGKGRLPNGMLSTAPERRKKAKTDPKREMTQREQTAEPSPASSATMPQLRKAPSTSQAGGTVNKSQSIVPAPKEW